MSLETLVIHVLYASSTLPNVSSSVFCNLFLVSLYDITCHFRHLTCHFCHLTYHLRRYLCPRRHLKIIHRKVKMKEAGLHVTRMTARARNEMRLRGVRGRCVSCDYASCISDFQMHEVE